MNEYLQNVIEKARNIQQHNINGIICFNDDRTAERTVQKNRFLEINSWSTCFFPQKIKCFIHSSKIWSKYL